MAKRTGEILGVDVKLAPIPAPNVALGGGLDTSRLKSFATPCEASFHGVFEEVCRARGRVGGLKTQPESTAHEGIGLES